MEKIHSTIMDNTGNFDSKKGSNLSIPILPLKVCFRVTRFCNARCGFCLAPPDGGVHPAVARLKHYIDWLFERGVKSIHFCGGEPTIHHNLPQLIDYVYEKGGKPKLTTNGIAISDELISSLYNSKTQVKVSLHGPDEFHNAMVGRTVFDSTTASIKRLITSGIRTSIQTTIIHNHLEIVDWIIQYCVENKIKRVSFLPFIPRGNGNHNREIYELTYSERRSLHELVKKRRKEYSTVVDIRLLDFNVQTVPVVEPDGRVVMESSTEAKDVLMYRIPEVM